MNYYVFFVWNLLQMKARIHCVVKTVLFKLGHIRKHHPEFTAKLADIPKTVYG
jgi:hypothetical protein